MNIMNIRNIMNIGLDWTKLDWTGLDWTGLDWTAPVNAPVKYILDWSGGRGRGRGSCEWM